MAAPTFIDATTGALSSTPWTADSWAHDAWLPTLRRRDLPLRDGLLRAAWRACVLAMIFTSGTLCLALSYRAVFEALDGVWRGALTFAIVSSLAGVAAKWLCENRNDLVEG